jgi:HSP20 family molecular chaperone IbpA
MTENTMQIEKKEEQLALDSEARRPHRILKPRIDLFEAEDVILLVADLPGVNEEDVEIVLERDRLTISGPMAGRAPEGYRVVYSEFCHGDFERSFVLTDDIDRDRIEANLESGVLRLTLPKAEKAQTRKILVQSNGSQ